MSTQESKMTTDYDTTGYIWTAFEHSWKDKEQKGTWKEVDTEVFAFNERDARKRFSEFLIPSSHPLLLSKRRVPKGFGWREGLN